MTRLHDNKYAMIVDISPPWMKPGGDSTKHMSISPIHLTRTNWVRASCADKTKYSIAHTSKHVTQKAPQHNIRCKIHLRHRTQMVEQSKLFASARMPSTKLHTKHWETCHPLAVGKSRKRGIASSPVQHDGSEAYRLQGDVKFDHLT